MIDVYRYTRVKGDDANKFPSISWRIIVKEDKVYCTYSVCQPGDNFSYVKGREYVDTRMENGNYLEFSYNMFDEWFKHRSLVHQVITYLSEYGDINPDLGSLPSLDFHVFHAFCDIEDENSWRGVRT